MEPKFQKQEPLATSVNKIRSQLRQTEWSLQSLEDQISSDGSSEDSISRAPLGLTLEDLVKPNKPEGKANLPTSRSNMALNGGDSMRRSRDKCSAVSAESFKNTDQENRQLREKLNCLQEQNKALISQNRALTSKMDSVEMELNKSKSRVRFFESAFGARTSRIPELEEQVVSLEAEVEAQEKALRNTEDQLEQSQHAVAEKEQVLQKLKEEMKNLKMELYDCCKQCKRAEKQRNEALLSAEDLTRAFQQYKKNVTEKLEKVELGELLKKNLTNCEKEREAVQEKCKLLEAELEKTKEHLRILKSERSNESERLQSVENKNAELLSLLTQSNQRIFRLETELESKENVLKENLQLQSENQELKSHLVKQSDWKEKEDYEVKSDSIDSITDLQYVKRVLDCKNGSEHPPAETAEPNSIRLLVADLRKRLSIKETENRELQARLMSINVPMNNCNENTHETASLLALEEEPVKLSRSQTEAEKYLKLELACKQLQADKERLGERVKELQGKLVKAHSEAASTKLSMAQRTSQFQVIQEELLEKASKATSLEQEMAKKSSKITVLQKQLEELTLAHSSSTTRNEELEKELMDCKEQIIHLEDNISKEHEEVLLAFEKSKKIHLEQHKELKAQIEHLHHQMDLKNVQITEQDRAVQALQQEILLKQRQLESLDQILTGTKRELDVQTNNKNDAIKNLEYQVEEETMKVQCLQKELTLTAVSLRDTSEENVRLQQALQQQQQMLQQGTARIGDLEDTQAELEKQIFKLEHKAQKQRSLTEEELRRTEEKLRAAVQEVDIKTKQVHELSSTLGHLKSELNHCQDKVAQIEGELTSQRCDREIKTNKLNQLEMTLQQTQAELGRKTQLVGALEEKIHRAEKDMLRKEGLESELRTIQEEMQDKGKLLEETQDLLTQTSHSLQERKAVIQDLTEELRICKSELEDRDHELLDMDQALKDRNWELQQRAAQLTQLDLSVREHKGEMEQKIIRLENALEKAQLDIKEHINQITSLDEKLQLARDQLCVKNFDLLEKDQIINNLKKEIERKQVMICDMEKSIKEQEKRISEQHQEGKELSHQVRLAREQMQYTHIELTDTRQQLASTQRESERLAHKLEETILLSREKQEHMKQELEEIQHTVCSLKTELQARNEVIKATNEVLILKESELTRLKGRISGYERTLGLMQQQHSMARPPESLSEHNPLDSSKHFQFSDSKNFGIRRSLSASDLSLTEMSPQDLPKGTMEDIKSVLVPNSALMSNNGGNYPGLSSDTFNDSSFNPLSYTVDDNCDAASDCTDLDTLSGMLKYIKKEMKKSEAVHAVSAGQEYGN